MCNPISAKKTVSAIETTGREGDTSVPYLFVIIFDYILRQSVYLMDENGLLLNPRASSESKYSRMDQVNFVEDSL